MRKFIALFLSASLVYSPINANDQKSPKKNASMLIPPAVGETGKIYFNGKTVPTRIQDEKERITTPLMIPDRKQTDFEKNVWVMKRGPGKRIGEADVSEQLINKKRQLIIKPRKDSSMIAQVCAHFYQASINYFIEEGILPDDLFLNRKKKVSIEFVHDNDSAVEAIPETEEDDSGRIAGLKFDTDIVSNFKIAKKGKKGFKARKISYRLKGKKITIPAEDVERGLRVYAAVSYAYGMCRVKGLDNRQTLRAMVALYADLDEPHQSSFMKVLRSPYVDSGNKFAIFLDDCFDSKMAGVDLTKESKEKESWLNLRITWLLSRYQWNMPNDLEEVRRIISSDMSKDEQAEALMKGPFRRDNYKVELERQNAYR